MELIIRHANARDASEIGELTEHAYRVDGFLNVEGSEKYAETLRDAAVRINDAVVLVAEANDHLVVTVTLAKYGTPLSQIAVPGELEVRMLAVEPEARRNGIAEQLMSVAEVHASNTGLDFLILSTEAPMFAAHKLYEKMGYVRQPKRDWSVSGYQLLVYRRRARG